MKTLNVIGAGRVGRTLARLWSEARAFAVQDVLCGTLESARSATDFIGAGRVIAAIEEMRPADVWMLTPPDAHIAACCARIAASGTLRGGDLVFHCSGALSSRELAAAAGHGALVASVHPLKSFADPLRAAGSFAGTYCTAEGDDAALAVLRPAFEAIGGRIVGIDPERKVFYHAASVIACNYLVALMEAGLRCYEKAGLARETASAMMEPLMRETLDNVLRLGTVRALTGPIARGDDALVARQFAAIADWDREIAALYRELGAIAIELAREQGKADPAALKRLSDLFAAGNKG